MRRERLICRVPSVWTIGAALASAPLLATLAVVAVGYGRGAAARRRARAACPFEDDDDAARPLARELADVVRETVAVFRAATSAAWTSVPSAWRSGAVGAARGPIVVLLPERGIPPASLVPLGLRLARELDASLHVEPRPRPWSDGAARADRLREHIAALAASAPGRTIVLVGHGAGGRVARRAAAVRPERLRIVTLGTPHARPGAPSPARTSDGVATTCLFSLQDPFVVPAERAFLSGADNVALHGEGHFGMLASARVSALVLEALADLAPRAAAS